MPIDELKGKIINVNDSVVINNVEVDDEFTKVSMKFNSVKTFNRVFKKLKGCSPKEYRKVVSKT